MLIVCDKNVMKSGVVVGHNRPLIYTSVFWHQRWNLKICFSRLASIQVEKEGKWSPQCKMSCLQRCTCSWWLALHLHFAMIRVSLQPLGVLSLPYTFYILYASYLQRVGWLVTSGRLWEINSVSSLCNLDRESMKGSGSVSWDSCGSECRKCVSYVSYVFRNVSQFISYSFPVKFSKLDKVEFIFIALPMGKFHVQCSSSVEKDSCTYALFTLLSNSSIPCYFKLDC